MRLASALMHLCYFVFHAAGGVAEPETLWFISQSCLFDYMPQTFSSGNCRILLHPSQTSM